MLRKVNILNRFWIVQFWKCACQKNLKKSRHQVFTYFDEGKKLMIAKENSINKASSRLLFEKYYISLMADNMSRSKVSLKLSRNRYFPQCILSQYVKTKVLLTDGWQKAGKIETFRLENRVSFILLMLLTNMLDLISQS